MIITLGKKFAINAKILLAKFSLLNIETILKGMANTEARIESTAKKPSKARALSFEAAEAKYREIGRIIKVDNAIYIS